MSDLIKQHFRASNGFDAADGKIINVAKADRTVMSDGVNVEYLIQENTIQPWADNRGYLAGFAVHFEKRIWVSRVDIAAPVPPAKNTFKQTEWVSMRVDPKWEEFTLGTDNRLDPGTYANVNTAAAPVTLRLPKVGVQDGDTIVVRDTGGVPGINKALITLSTDTGGVDPLPIIYRGSQVKEVMITRPYSMFLFTYSRTGWYATLTDMSSIGRMISAATPDAAGDNAKGAQIQSSDNIFRKYTGTKLTVRLPQWASHGDIITFSEPDGQTPLYHFTIKSYDSGNSASIGSAGTREMTFKGRGGGQIVYDGPSNVWVVDANDFRQRLQVITADINLQPNGAVSVFGADNTTQKTITITLPTNISVGDTAFVSMEYMRKGQTVVIKAATGDKIATSVGLLQFPRRSEYPPDGAWVMNDQISFNGTSSYPTDIELAYIEEAGSKYWIVVENKPTVERVDAKDNTTRARVGVIALANQDEVNATSGYQKEKAVTPETLAGRTAQEGRTGIAKISTLGQAQANSNTTLNDDTIMTPKKVDARTATEARRGVAYVATQGDTNTGTDDTKMITSKKLNDRIATIDRTGIISLVKTGAKPATVNREDAGEGVYNHNDHFNAVTPKTLREYKATEKASGAVWLASDNEVRTPPAINPNIPIVVTPQSLQKKTSNVNEIGLIQLASQAEANAMTNPVNNKAITPETLNGRKASYTQTGILRFAIQDEFDGGALEDVAVNPRKIKEYFSRPARFITKPDESGIIHSGNMWDGITINSRASGEAQRGTARIATQTEVNAGADDTTIVTPKKLQNKKASESVYGIMQYATQDQVVAGTIKEMAVAPVHLKHVIQTEDTWKGTEIRRGTVKVTKDNSLTWTGTSKEGSDAVAKESEGFAVSPLGLKYALANYLPLNATADNAVLHNGLRSDQFIRRDNVAQTVDSTLTLTKVMRSNSNIETSALFKSNGLETTSDIRIRNSTARLLLTGSSDNSWSIQAASASGRIAFISEGNTSDVWLSVYNDARGITARHKFDAPNLNATSNVTISDKVALEQVNGRIKLGNTSQGIIVDTSNASDIQARESNNTYKFITTKNFQQELNATYVRKDGDTMTGDLKINNASIVNTGSEGWYNSTSPNAMGKQGSWTVEVKDATKINSLPGYMVPVREQIDPTKPDSPYVVTRYIEKKGAGGLLAQTGVSTNYTYQIWTPYAPNTETNELAKSHTAWMRVWNPRLNSFDTWMRIFTSATPPTAADIGAPSSVSTQVKTLEVLEWIKIGPVRIYPDRTTETVKFEWVGD